MARYERVVTTMNAAPREGCVEGGGSYSMRHVSVLDRLWWCFVRGGL